ncbi:MAG: universal stress protein [Enterococcus sp.]
MSNEYKTIVVPVDGSILADLAYQKAKRYAETYDSKLIILNVVDTTSIEMHDFEFGIDLDPVLESAQTFINDYAEDAKKSSIDYEAIATVGNAKNVILKTIEEKQADAIFMGASGTNAITRLIIGSTTDFIVRHAPIDVFVVKTHLDNHTRPTH